MEADNLTTRYLIRLRGPYFGRSRVIVSQEVGDPELSGLQAFLPSLNLCVLGARPGSLNLVRRTVAGHLRE